MTAFYPAIPAGGSGTRLWPLSRRTRPKFLLPLTGGRSLLRITADRLLPLSAPDRLLVVAGTPHAAAIREQLPELPTANLVVEPEPRESGPAIALAAALVHERDPDGITGSFAADHAVTDVPAFHAAVGRAIAAAADGALVTIGITPTGPATGYGYIRTGPVGEHGAHRVQQFREKPDLATAQQYLAGGGYVWNAGMFVWRAVSLLAEVRRQLPELYTGVTEIAAAYTRGDGPQVHAELWPSLPAVSIDVGIMEGAAERGAVACVPATFGWTDVGDWDSLAGLLTADADGTTVLGEGLVLARDSAGCMVSLAGRPVVLIGVHDLVVADAGDAVLVCPRDRAQDVGGIVAELRAAGRDDLT